MTTITCHAGTPCPCCCKTVPYARLHPVYDGLKGELYCPTCKGRCYDGDRIQIKSVKK